MYAYMKTFLLWAHWLIFSFQRPPKAIVYKTVLLCPFLNQLALSSEISLLSRLPSFFSKLCFQGQMQYLPFSPSLLLQSSHHLPCTNCAHIPAGFTCKSYLNLSPAAMQTVREMDENGPPGYCCNLQNEHEFALWDIRAWTWATSWNTCVSLICSGQHQARFIAQAWLLL